MKFEAWWKLKVEVAEAGKHTRYVSAGTLVTAVSILLTVVKLLKDGTAKLTTRGVQKCWVSIRIAGPE